MFQMSLSPSSFPPASSESSMCDQIYFRDRKGEIKGPYTERQVQEWYRLKWFDSDFPFYFMANDDVPTDATPSTTLGELRTRFGPCCPFQRVEKDDGMAKMVEKVEAMEKELTALRKECEQVKALKQRVIKLEKRLQAFSAPPTLEAVDKENVAPAAVAVAAAVPEPKTAAAIVKPAAAAPAASKYADEKWYSELVDLVVESFEMIGGRNYSRAGHIANSPQLKKGRELFEKDEKEQKHFMDAVMKKMTATREYYHCAPCDVFFFQSSQAWHHLWQVDHVEMLEFAECTLKRMTDAIKKLLLPAYIKWFLIESKPGNVEEQRFEHVEITPAMRPSNDFIQKEIIGKMLAGPHGGFRSKAAFFDAQIGKLKNGMDEKIEQVLRKHIGSAQTFCDICDTATGTVDEYFAHLRRFDHVMKMKLFHVPTVVANRLAIKEQQK